MAKRTKNHSLEQTTILCAHLERFVWFQCPHKSRNVKFLSFRLFSYSLGQFQYFLFPEYLLKTIDKRAKKCSLEKTTILCTSLERFIGFQYLHKSKCQIFIIFCYFHTFMPILTPFDPQRPNIFKNMA